MGVFISQLVLVSKPHYSIPDHLCYNAN